MPETREHIKARMLKNMARLWGYPETQAEASFDPLVAMLLSVCAGELEKVSGEIHASQTRLLQRMVQLLAPETITGALPGHAVATAQSLEPTTVLGEDAQFSIELELPYVQDNRKRAGQHIFFSPTGTFPVNRAAIRFMALGNQLYKKHDTHKEVIAVSNRSALPPSTLWLGIDAPDVSLDQTLFYFDLLNEANKPLFAHQLPRAKWFYNGLPVEASPGYGNQQISGERFDSDDVRVGQYGVLHSIRKQVNAFYKPCFITLSDAKGVTVQQENEQSPAIIHKAFGEKEAELLQKQPLRWVTVQFPETISNRLLEDVVCTMNCFPVINRQVHEVHYLLQEMINVVPLHFQDSFLDLEEVRSEEDEVSKAHPLQPGASQSFSVVMRTGGVGRFDERDAASLIEYLVELLRDESVAFSMLGHDFVNGEVKQLQQVINKLEQRLSARSPFREPKPYLVIQPARKMANRNVFISYSSTQGGQANYLKAGTKLHPYNNVWLSISSLQLVSRVQGGRDKLKPSQSVLAYKSALLSKDRLVTAEDIKAFCYAQLGERLAQVSIRHGTLVPPDERQGYAKTLDVILSLREEAYHAMHDKGELRFWQENLTRLLEQKSSCLVQYRILIKKTP
jgi:hypothetical protein